MANLTLRSTTSATDPGSTSAKASALTHVEMDSNFILLQADIDGKISSSSPTLTGTIQLANNGILQLNEATANGSNYVQIKTPASVASNYVLTLPPDDGSAGQVLTTDGSGVLTFTDKTALTGLDIDGFTDGTGITLAATDKFLVSDDDASDAEKKINASQIDTYVSGTTATLTNKTLTTPVLSGAITTASNGDITFDPNDTGDVLTTPTIPSGTAGPGLQFGWNSNSTGGAAHIKSVLSVDAGSDDPTTNLLFNEGIQITATALGDGSTAGGYDSDFSWPTLAFLSNDKHGSLTSPNTDRNSGNQAYGNIWFVKQNKDATNTTQAAVESNQILGGFFGAGSKNSSSLAPTSAKFFMRATEDFSGSANGTRMEFSATPNGDTQPIQCLDINGDSVVINEDSEDVDFRVESNNVANAIKVDAGQDEVSFETVKIMMPNLPTSDPTNAGQLWNDSGTLKVSAG